MKLDCNVIEDLLPLYLDNVCSEQSKMIVEEHIKECDECHKLIDNEKTVQIPHMEPMTLATDNVVKKGFKKIRKRWIAFIVAVLMSFPIIGIGFLSYHESTNTGIAFSNLDDICRCFKFLHHIKNSEFEKAASMVDFSENEYTLVESVADMTLEEYELYMKDRFVKKLLEYETLGISIDNIRYDSAYKWSETGIWCICISFDEIYPDGSSQKIIADLNGKTMYAGAYSYPEKGKTEKDDYIDEILCLYSEDDILDYQDFEVTFELKEGEKVVIRRKDNSNIDVDGVFNISYGTGTALIEEPYYQNVFASSVPGKYSVMGFSNEGEIIYLSMEELDIEIINYKEK